MNDDNKVVSVGEIAFERSERIDDPSSSEVDVFVGLEHFDSGSLDIVRYGSTNDLGSAMKKCLAGDTLIARRNVYLKRASRCNFDALCSGDAIILREKDGIVPGFLPIVFNSDSFWRYALSNADGTMSKRLSVAHLKSYEFNLPTLEKQRKIVDLVWKIENLKSKLITKINLINQLIKSKFIEMFSTVEKNSRNFVFTSIESCCDILDSMRVPITSSNRISGPYPYYGANGIQDYISEYLFDDDLILLAEDGGHFNEIGRVAYSVSGKFWVNNHAHVLKPRESMNSIYLEYALNSLDFRNIVKGTTRQKLNQESMKKIKILCPPINFQNEFADFTKQTTESKLGLQQHIENTKKLQKTIINDIFGDE